MNKQKAVCTEMQTAFFDFTPRKSGRLFLSEREDDFHLEFLVFGNFIRLFERCDRRDIAADALLPAVDIDGQVRCAPKLAGVSRIIEHLLRIRWTLISNGVPAAVTNTPLSPPTLSHLTSQRFAFSCGNR